MKNVNVLPAVVAEAELVAKANRYYVKHYEDAAWAPRGYDRREYLVDLFRRMAVEVRLPGDSPLWDWVAEVNRDGGNYLDSRATRQILERLLEKYYVAHEDA